jgi:hypothetical protein
MSNPYASSTAPFSPSSSSPSSSSRVEIRSIGILSCAKLMGALYGILGLIIGAFMTLFSMAGAALSNNGQNAGLVMGLGAASIVLIPITYGIIGFIGGIIMSFFYNVIAGMVGGIEIKTNAIH